MRISEEFKNYGKELAKRGISLYDIDRMSDNCIITMTQDTFYKNGRKNFPVKASETETTEITVRQYACYVTSIGYFGDRVYSTYTCFGYIPYKLTCINPDRTTKITRTFKFERKQNA